MNNIELQFGDVREKSISTKNDFISHMIEHIAWRLGTKIKVEWDNDDWFALGVCLGQEITKFQPKQKFGVALGMLDDGSAEIKIELGKEKEIIKSANNINLEWFLSQRCEQLSSGKPLVTLLEGLSKGLGAGIEVTICNFEDQHHTWEGIYRGVGIALSKIFTPQNALQTFDSEAEMDAIKGDISVKARSGNYALVSRGTAETGVSVGIDFTRKLPNSFSINTNNSINVTGMEKLLGILAEEGGFTMQVNFNAMVLSSSHVVMEDIGLVLGRACLEVLKIRMEKFGVNGTGSSLQTIDDMDKQAIRVGISVEGRKFWRFTPMAMSYQELREKLLIGKNIYSNVRSEDLDDFIDGLSGGLSGSIMIHIQECGDVEKVWEEIFKGLGAALREVFTFNTNRKGVPPGVKATLS